MTGIHVHEALAGVMQGPAVAVPVVRAGSTVPILMAVVPFPPKMLTNKRFVTNIDELMNEFVKISGAFDRIL